MNVDVDCADPYSFPDVVSPTPEESSGLQSVGSGKLPFLWLLVQFEKKNPCFPTEGYWKFKK